MPYYIYLLNLYFISSTLTYNYYSINRSLRLLMYYIIVLTISIPDYLNKANS